MLVGTLSGHEDREVSQEIVTNFAQEQNISYFECNVDSGSGIDDIFSVLIDKVMDNFHAATRDMG